MNMEALSLMEVINLLGSNKNSLSFKKMNIQLQGNWKQNIINEIVEIKINNKFVRINYR